MKLAKVNVSEKKLQILFCAHIRENWIDLHQTNTEMIFGPFFLHISSNTFNFTSENAQLFDICLFSIIVFLLNSKKDRFYSAA